MDKFHVLQSAMNLKTNKQTKNPSALELTIRKHRVREGLLEQHSENVLNVNVRPLALPLGCCALFELSVFLFQINMTHYIKHLSFGRDYPGIVNPLDGTDVTAQQGKSQLREIFLGVSINES